MSTTKDVAALYDLVLSSGPGMSDFIKLDTKISCRTALLMVMSIEQGSLSPDPANVLKKILSEDDLLDLTNISTEILKKGKLEILYSKLKEMAR